MNVRAANFPMISRRFNVPLIEVKQVPIFLGWRIKEMGREYSTVFKYLRNLSKGLFGGVSEIPDSI